MRLGPLWLSFQCPAGPFQNKHHKVLASGRISHIPDLIGVWALVVFPSLSLQCTQVTSSPICLLCFLNPLLPLVIHQNQDTFLFSLFCPPSSPSCPFANTSCSIQTEVSVIENRVIHKSGKERVSGSARLE